MRLSSAEGDHLLRHSVAANRLSGLSRWCDKFEGSFQVFVDDAVRRVKIPRMIEVMIRSQHLLRDVGGNSLAAIHIDLDRACSARKTLPDLGQLLLPGLVEVVLPECPREIGDAVEMRVAVELFGHRHQMQSLTGVAASRVGRPEHELVHLAAECAQHLAQ